MCICDNKYIYVFKIVLESSFSLKIKQIKCGKFLVLKSHIRHHLNPSLHVAFLDLKPYRFSGVRDPSIQTDIDPVFFNYEVW